MDINRAGFGALAVAGIVAAGGGAYLANRHNDTAVVAVGTGVCHTDGRRSDRNRKPDRGSGWWRLNQSRQQSRNPSRQRLRGSARERRTTAATRPHSGTPARSHAELRR